MNAKENKKKIIIVGPHLESMGGISRVLKIWQKASFFPNHNVKYIPSVTDAPVNKILFLIKNLFKFSISLLGRCNLVYIHSSLYHSFYRKSLFILLSIFFRKKILLHIHPSGFHLFLSKLRRIERNYSLFVLRRVHIFVVLTNEMKNEVNSVFPQKTVCILPNPVNTHQMIKESIDQRKKNELLYLGWYTREKGVYELVDAVQILVRTGLKIHMSFYGTKEIEKLKWYVRKKNLTKQITVNGWITGNKKWKTLFESTVLILPSYTEGIPNVILEAMASKTPIIATSVGGLKEILVDRENAIISEVGDPTDLSEKIKECLENKELRNRIVTNAYKDVTTKYDVHIIKDMFSQVIKKIEAGVG